MLSFWPQRKFTRSAHAKPRTLRIESLAARITMHGSGLGVSDPLPWFDPGALTYSFAPDGTDVAGQQSSLFAVLNELGEPSTWQAQIDAAIDAWLKPLGVEAHAVADSGARFGVPGLTQGDIRFGDIRIASIPLSNDVIATSVPHSAIVQGTWAGDILLNSNANWTSLHDVFAVALHEVGHVLGLEHSTDPHSPMFVHGVHDALAPTEADFATLTNLYSGIEFKDDRDPQEQRADGHGEAFASAINLTPLVGTRIRYTSGGTLTAGQDSLIFRLDPTRSEAPELQHLNVALRSTGSQRLIAEVDVFNEDGQLVESQVLHHSEGAVVLQARDVSNEKPYYVRVRAADTSPSFQIGDFELIVEYGPKIRESREIADVHLSSSVPALTQNVTIDSSRFVHLSFDAEARSNPGNRVWATLFNSDGVSLARATFAPGQSRSMPIVFLPAGAYTLVLAEGKNVTRNDGETRINVFVNEISLDVGPGATNPTGQPYLMCEDPNAAPDFCYNYIPVETTDPFVSNSAPSSPNDPDWWIYYGYSCSDYLGPDLNDARQYDPQWWEFYTMSCVGTTPPTTTPATTTPPTTTPPTTSPPTTSPPTTSPPTTTPPTTSPPTTTPPTTTPPTTTPPTTSPPTTTPPTTTPPTTTPPTTTPPTTTPPTTTPPTTTTTISPRQNQANNYDVSGDSVITPLDVLIIINVLSHNSRSFVDVLETTITSFADVNGDFIVSPLDVLWVINKLSRHATISEGETPPIPLVETDRTQDIFTGVLDENEEEFLLF